jgi:predicted amidohydrolase
MTESRGSNNIRRVALAQIDCKLGDVEHNTSKALEIIDEHRDDVDLIVFPELALTGYGVGQKFHEYALRRDDPTFRRLIDAAAGVTVAFGFIEETPTFQFYNSLAFVHDRQLVHVHRKIYLPNYGIFEERKYFSPGKRYTTFELDDGLRIGPFVCGDAWNPGLVHLAAAELAHVLVFSVCSPRGGLGSRLSSDDSWRRLNRFYATIYGCYVIFVNRVGQEANLSLWGESELVDPFGDQVVQAGTDEEVVVAELDIQQVREARTTLHTIRDENFDFLQRRLQDVMEFHNRH